jgi:lysozyme
MNIERVTKRLVREEGTKKKNGRHVLYKDSVGIWTIGFGRNVQERGISDSEAYFMLANDIQDHQEELQHALPWIADLDEVRQEVLLDLAFNMGVPTLLTFKSTLGFIRDGRYAEARIALLKSKYAGQVGDRAIALADALETGIFKTNEV